MKTFASGRCNGQPRAYLRITSETARTPGLDTLPAEVGLCTLCSFRLMDRT